jgi:hypothetical protein
MGIATIVGETPSSSIPCQPLPSPMGVFPRRIEHALNVTVQRSHDTDPREHRWSALFRDQQQRFHRGLPFVGIVFRLGRHRAT